MKRHIAFLVLLVFVLGAAGCVTTGVNSTKYTAFKDSTAALAKDTRASYAGVQKLQSLLYSECMARFDDKHPYNMTILAGKAPPCRDGLQTPIDATDHSQLLKSRLAALDALARYATVLNTLASYDNKAELEAASAKLSASLATLHSSATGNDGMQAASTVFGKVVQRIGQMYTEGKRKEALRTVQTEAQPWIEQLAAHMTADSAEIRSLTHSYARSYVSLMESGRPKDKEQRAKYDTMVLSEYQTGQELQSVLNAQSKAVNSLSAAHMDLIASLDASDSPTKQIAAFVAAVEQLSASLQALKNN